MPIRAARPRRWWLVPLVVTAVAVGLVGFRRYERWRCAGVLAEARTAVRSGRFAAALASLSTLPTGMDGRDEVDYLMGVGASALGRPEDALGAWGRVPDGSTFAARAAVQRVRVGLPLGRFSTVETLAPAFDDPKLGPEARQNAAFILKVEGRAREARKLFQDGWHAMPNAVGALLEIWRLDHQPLAAEVSRGELERAAAKAPDDDRVWLGRANLATWEGKHEEAAKWLRACLARRPDDPAVWRAKLFHAQTLGDSAGVWEALERLKASDLEADEIPSLRAWLAARDGRSDLERQALLERVALRPEDLAAQDRLAELATEPAEAVRRRAARAEVVKTSARCSELLFGDDPLSHAAEIARLCEALGRPFDARAWWTLRARSDPGDPDARAGVARLDAASKIPKEPPSRATLSERFADLKTVSSTPRPADTPREAPRFVDGAGAAGLSFTYNPGPGPRTPPMMMGGGVGLLDYDGDGRLDVYLVQGGAFPPPGGVPPQGDRLFRNRGDGTFEDATARAGLAGFPGGYGYGVTVGDVDRDGLPDLFVTRWRSYALYRNKGGGAFEDVTDAWGLGGARDWPTSAAFADLDGDGDLDLYVCHYLAFDPADPSASSRMPGLPPTMYSPLMYEALPDHLFRNDGGRFTDVSAASGVSDKDGRGLGVVACDFDADGRVDLFVANDLTGNFLYRNLGGLKFEECAHAAGVAAGTLGGFQAGMGVACGDLDGDGKPDLVVTNFYGEGTSLFHNLGAGLFADHSARAGLTAVSRYRLGFGVAVFDADDDGLPDLATANGHVVDTRPTVPFAMPAQLLAGIGGGRLADVTDRAGDLWGKPRVARGLAVGDLDDDGRLDAVIVAQGSPVVIAMNTSTRRHFVSIRLEGRTSNRDAVGARVTVKAGGRAQTAWRTGGGSYLSASEPRLHFGLGDASLVDSLEIGWPSGRVDLFQGLAVDTHYRLSEGAERPTKIGSGPQK